ncbi:MAG TPA: hypothetical protein VG015_02635 [Candidatus Dormibacteraeota bacterium]|nr:hypothetical protein [Candidatus Dormibacteraeota bacterium]
MKIHRVVTLVLMLALGVAALLLLLSKANLGSSSLVALGVVVIAAALGGVAMSWKRYRR